MALASAERRNAAESRVTVRRRLRRREFQATSRQPGLNSHLNASEVALAAITADGRLLTRALPATELEPPGKPSWIPRCRISSFPSLSLSFFLRAALSLSVFPELATAPPGYKPCFTPPAAPGARKTRHGEEHLRPSRVMSQKRRVALKRIQCCTLQARHESAPLSTNPRSQRRILTRAATNII